MPRLDRSTVMMIVAVGLVLLALVNLTASFAFLSPAGPELETIDPAREADTPRAEITGGAGGITRVTGIPVFLTGIAMLVIAISLFLRASWAITAAAVILGIDIVLKVIHIVAELIAGIPITDLLLTFVLILVEGVLLYLLVQERQRISQVETRPVEETRHSVRE